jgi:hypothetical protein
LRGRLCSEFISEHSQLRVARKIHPRSGLPCFRVGLPVAATQLNRPQRCCSLVRK